MMMMMMEAKQHQALCQLLLLLLLLGIASIAKSSCVSDEIEKGHQTILYAAIASSLLIPNHMASSVVLPLYGNVYPRGFYYVSMKIGNPAKPYFLDPDTGSDLTWLQCDAPCIHCTKAPHPLYKPSNDLIQSTDPLCAAVQPPYHRLKNFEQCHYKVEYADGGSSLGVLLREVIPLNFTNGHKQSPRLAIGCGYDQIPGSSYHPIDGVLGLGKGKVGIVSQLTEQGFTRNVIGHCLCGQGGGYLFFGSDVYDPSHIIWTRMSHDHSKHYSSGLAELLFDQKATGVKNLLVVFDSGSSYTYLASQPYHTLVSLITKQLQSTSLKDAVEDDTLPVCWKGKKPFRSIREVENYFKPLALSFGSRWKSAARFDIPPDNYLIISEKGSVCLGILNGSEVGLQDLNVIGDISMQDKMVIYDNEAKKIGWGSSDCSRVPKGVTVDS